MPTTIDDYYSTAGATAGLLPSLAANSLLASSLIDPKSPNYNAAFAAQYTKDNGVGGAYTDGISNAAWTADPTRANTATGQQVSSQIKAAQADETSAYNSLAEKQLDPYGQQVISDLNNNNFAGAWQTAESTAGAYGTNTSGQTEDPLLQALESSQGLEALDPTKQWNDTEINQYYSALGDSSGYANGNELGQNPYGDWGNKAALLNGTDATANEKAGGAPNVLQYAGAKPTTSFLSKYGAPILGVIGTIAGSFAGDPELGATLGAMASDVGNVAAGHGDAISAGGPAAAILQAVSASVPGAQGALARTLDGGATAGSLGADLGNAGAGAIIGAGKGALTGGGTGALIGAVGGGVAGGIGSALGAGGAGLRYGIGSGIGGVAGQLAGGAVAGSILNSGNTIYSSGNAAMPTNDPNLTTPQAPGNSNESLLASLGSLLGGGSSGGISPRLLSSLLGLGTGLAGNLLNSSKATSAADAFATETNFNPDAVQTSSGTTSFNGTNMTSSLSPAEQANVNSLNGMVTSSASALAAGPTAAANNYYNTLQQQQKFNNSKFLGSNLDNEFANGIMSSTAGQYQTGAALNAVNNQSAQDITSAENFANNQQADELNQLTTGLSGLSTINQGQLAQGQLGVGVGSAASSGNNDAYQPELAANSGSPIGSLLAGLSSSYNSGQSNAALLAQYLGQGA